MINIKNRNATCQEVLSSISDHAAIFLFPINLKTPDSDRNT